MNLNFVTGMSSRSRNHSRAASPTLSVRSRRSMISSRSRNKYLPQDLTDDEDSDIENFTDDSRSRLRRHEGKPRSRRNTEQLDLDHRDTEVINRIQKMKEKSKYIRERRSGSLTNWPATKSRDSGSLTPSDDDLRTISSKHRKSSLMSLVQPQKKLLSDSASEKEMSFQQKKEERIASKVIKQVKSDSASERENTKQKPLKVVDSPKAQKKPETESDNEEVVPVVTKLESESRPLKVVTHLNNISKTSNESKASSTSTATSTAQSTSAKKEEKKIIQNENQEMEQQTTLEPLASPVIVVAKAKVKDIEVKKEAAKIAEAWECQHCTFVNDAVATVCTICCKTRVDVLQQLPNTVDDDIDINEINESISQNESDAKQKGKVRKISFLPGTKAH